VTCCPELTDEGDILHPQLCRKRLNTIGSVTVHIWEVLGDGDDNGDSVFIAGEGDVMVVVVNESRRENALKGFLFISNLS
jgi:hypothetical protein